MTLGVPHSNGQPSPADPSQGVYVRDSAIAADKFELGKRMERLKEWHKSADVYQEILEKYQDRVVPTVTDEKGRPIQYASVTVAVQQQLARWPQEGLAVYRARFEPAATVVLEQINYDDYPALHRVFARYFVTDAARRAGLRLMDLYLEGGEFAAAAWIGQQLLEWHPNLATERPDVLFRTALAYHLSSNPGLASKHFDELKSQFPNETGPIAGKPTKLAEALGAQLQRKPPVARGAGGDSWATVGGNASRSLVPKVSGTPGAKVYSIDLPGPIVEGLADQQKRALLDAHSNARNLNLTINVMPVVDRGELYFQDGYRVYAVHLESGVPLPGWAQTHGGGRGGQYWLPGATAAFATIAADQLGMQAAIPRQHSLTLTDDALVAVMGQPVQTVRAAGFFGGNAQQAGTRLVCLDRATGRQRWIVAPRSAPDDQANIKNLQFSGSPLIVGDNVYVIARGGTGAGVEDCHVHCYSLATGENRWTCYVASSQSGPPNMGGMPSIPDDGDTLSHLAFASGRIFVLTNLGAVAAIDAYSGATAWLTLYPRDDALLERQNRMMRGWFNPGMTSALNLTNLKPWQFNPVIISEGKVFVLPTDGKNVFIYDAGSGAELKRIPCEIDYGGRTRKLNMLLAVADRRMILADANAVLYLDWTTYAPPKDDPRKLDEQSVFAGWVFEDINNNEIRGRPFVTADRVYVPLKSHLAVIDLLRARISEARFPRKPGTWSPEEGPGNVLVTQDHVVVANQRNLSVYTDLEGVRHRYLAALKADPGNVESRLVFCELMFNAREHAEAIKAMDDAIAVLGGLRAMRGGTLRDRVFSDALLFAQRIGQENTPDSQTLAEALFDRAEAAASSVSQQVSYRVARAKFIESPKPSQTRPDLARAVRLYQEILNDSQMRAVPLAGEDGSAIPAARKAEDAITDLLRKGGPSVYEQFDQQAAAALAALAQARNADKLLALAEQYPHSSSAPQALMRAAELYESSGSPRMATIVLRRLYWKYEQRYRGEARAVLFEAMARNYLQSGNVGAALGRLQTVSKTLPAAKLSGELKTPDRKPLTTPQGRPVQTMQEAAAALELFASQQRRDVLPDAHLPALQPRKPGEKWRGEPFAAKDAASVIGNVQSIVRPPVDLSDHARYDRLIIWSAGKLVCLSAPSNQPLWTSPALSSAPTGLAWLDQNVVIWSESEIAVLDSEGGKLTWKADLTSLPAATFADSVADERTQPAPVDAAAELRQVELERRAAIPRRVLIGGIGLAAVQPILPDQQPPADGRERILHIRPLADRLIVVTSTGRAAALDLPKGKLLWQTRLGRSPSIRRTLASDEFVVVHLVEGGTAQLVVLDTFSGQPTLRKKFVGNASWPLNCALSPAGILVWTTAQSLAAKDLYEPGETATWEQRGLSFANLVLPEQLLIYNQQVLAVCNNGRLITRRFLRSGEEAPGPNLLNTNTGDETASAAVRLRLAENRLYVFSDHAVIAYSLDEGTSAEIKNDEVKFLPADSLVTKDHLILPGLVIKSQAGIGLVLEDRPPTPTTYTLQCHSRALIRDQETGKLGESAMLHYLHNFDEPSKVKAWQAVEGGVYYLAGDDKLHFLRGARQ